MKNEIVIVTALFPPEPVVSANLSMDIAASLSLQNEVVVLAPKPSRPAGTSFAPVNEQYRFTKIIVNSFVFPESKILGRIKESYSFGIETAKYIKTNKARIKAIYANTWPLFGQYFLAKTAARYGIPLVLHVQDVYPDSLVKKLPRLLGTMLYAVLLPLDKYILSQSSKIVCISPDMITHLSDTRKIKKAKFVLVRNWQNDDNFREVKEKPTGTPFTFMYLGNISASAGVEILIEAFNLAKIPNARLVIAGDGVDKEKCQNLVRKLQNDSIVFMEAPLAEVASLQSEADILLLPLRKGVALTASPSKLTAYMLSARPIIACVEEESDTAKSVLKCHGGFVTAPGCIDGLSKMMQHTSEMPALELLNMGKNAREFALSNLSRTANLSKIQSLIETIANGNQAG